MIIEIYIGADKLDLFKDDNIILKNSIAEIEDITKVFTESTNTFSVPATPNNNKIFKHFYNANLLNGWDVFSKVDAIIYMNGIPYRQGKIQLQDVILKSEQPSSYSIAFYGLLTSLKDLLGNTKLKDLDFSSLNFTINSTNLLNKLTSSTLDDIVNTTLSTRRMIYDSNSGTNNTNDTKNIANNNTSFNSGLDLNFTYSSIRNIKVIEAIEDYFGITFSRDYFGVNNFNNLYLLLNGGGLENQIEQQIVFDTFTSDPTLENDRILLSTNETFDETNILRISINCQGVNQTEPFTSIIKANGKEIHKVDGQGRASDGLYVYIVKKSDFEVFENLTFHVKSASALDFRFTVDRNTFPLTSYKSEKNYSVLTGTFDVASRMPDITCVDYLKGLFSKDKLIAFNTSQTEIYVDSLERYYQLGQVKEITKHIDFKERPISTGKIFSEINYKFSEPSTILAKEFFNNNNVNYGDLEYKIVDINGNKVDGESIDIELPFENMVYEKLLDISGVNDVNFMYGYMADDSLKPVNVKAHLHYVENISTTSQIKVLTGSSSYTLVSNLNVPLHTLGVNAPIYSTVFGEEFNEYNGNLISNTIYSNFHKTYIENAFNSQKRMYKFTAKNVPIQILLGLKLNDVIEIKQQYYRIDKYNINLITKEVSFELYNIKNLVLNPSYQSITTDSTIILTDSTIVTTDNNS